MSDAPELTGGTFEYNEKKYRVEEEEPERWFVYDGERHIGDIEHTADPDGQDASLYVCHAAEGDEGDEAEPMEGWRVALEYLIDHSR
jgi:hypothetical protein